MTYHEAHQHASRHRAEILQSEQCGCFYCLRIFPPSEIEEWIDEGQTALCPYCGIDAVLGSASGAQITEDFLGQMRERYF
ncbi:cytoplasmic protein [Meiothermus sp.]|uniref:cytoplasmic protein n=1 Tax=Meiothermus sp. TaxID=1955249 RepID=UPI00307E3034